MLGLARGLQGDPTLASRVAGHAASDARYWDFREAEGRVGVHGFFQYPAMMVPELQGRLIDDLLATDTKARTIYDPFMGAGTVAVEAHMRGLDFVGTDINPMAVLLTHVKTSPPDGETAAEVVRVVVDEARRLDGIEPHSFLHRDKWFKPEIVTGLSQLRRAIQNQPDQEMRRFLWVCLAETVRVVSNSRMSTFKLHLYDSETLALRTHNAIEVFAAVGASNSQRATRHWLAYRESRWRDSVGEVQVSRRSVFERIDIKGGFADAIMTSPPYGDNHTTVPYGQHSYLPASWIDRKDMVGDLDESLLATPGTIDTASLGGTRSLREERVAQLIAEDGTIAPLLRKLAGSRTLQSKVVSFVDDYAAALRVVVRRVRPRGYSFWTLGQRRVGGIEVPLVALTRGVLEDAGCVHVATLTRDLHRKRMANRNRTGQTMVTERILILQNG